MATVQLYGGAGVKDLFGLDGAEVITSITLLDNGAGTLMFETDGERRYTLTGSGFAVTGLTLTAGSFTGMQVDTLADGDAPLIGLSDFGTWDVVTLLTGAAFAAFKAQSITIFDASAPDPGQANEMIGGALADTIRSDSGEDQIDAGKGADVIIIAVADGVQDARVIDIDGGDGVDRLRFDATGLVAGFANMRGLGQLTDVEAMDLVGGVRVEFGQQIFRTGKLSPTGSVTANDGTGIVALELGALTTATLAGLHVSGDVRFEVTGGALGDSVTGNAGSVDMLMGLDGNDTLAGLGGADELLGGAGNDRLDGGAGADSMVGDMGDDVYVVDNAADQVIEGADGGTDTAEVLIDWQLLDEVERGVVISATGRALSGNGGDNRLTGGVGNDSVLGGEGADQIFGMAGNDLLDGQSGDDTLSGGAGNDRYVISDADVVFEAAGAGRDVLLASVSLLLGDNVEDAVVTGAAGLALRGNGLANALTGAAGGDSLRGDLGQDVLRGMAGADRLQGDGGNDRLDGGAGVDQMLGGWGDDTYVVSEADVVVELAGQGRDTVKSGGSVVLAAQVEVGVLTGLASANLTGNSMANTLTGNRAANRISGGDGADVIGGLAGSDTLEGGAGADVFVFTRGQDSDRIADFDAAGAVHDRVDLRGVAGTISGFADLTAHHMTQSGGNVRVDAGGGDVFLLMNISVSALDAGDFVF